MKKLLIIIFLLLSSFSFWKINEQNYSKQKEIKKEIIEHPEDLPRSDSAKITSFWFKNIKADYYWLNTIQYIGANAFHSEYKKYLYLITNLVTDLNPYFEHPYVLAQLLLTDYNPRYEDLTDTEQEKHLKEAIKIWKKWVENFCNQSLINKVTEINDLNKIWWWEEFKNTCKWYKIAYYLAFNYYYHLNDAKNAAKYYKIASTSDNAPEWTKILAAIMQWKWWEREKSYFMFLDLAKQSNKNKDEACNIISTQLQNIWSWLFLQKNISINWQLIEEINKLAKNNLWEYSNIESNRDNKNECYKYIYKSIRELNLFYIESANKIYHQETWNNSKNQEELSKNGYLDYIVEDYQQYEDYWIQYFYNEKTNSYDYEIKHKKQN